MEEKDYGAVFKPDRKICVIKKDGTLEAFNVQKVIDAVGKSAYRALTEFTPAEKDAVSHRGRALAALRDKLLAYSSR